jgi:cell division protein FtsB
MKPLTLILVILLGFLQYKLWIGSGSLTEVRHLEEARLNLLKKNAELTERNESLAAEVMDLKHGKEAVEERARSEMGMIKANETFYQIIDRQTLSGTVQE